MRLLEAAATTRAIIGIPSQTRSGLRSMLNYQKPERDIQLRKPKKTKKQLTFKESPSQESEAHLKLSMFHLSFRVKWSSHGYLHLPDIRREAEAFLLS